MSARRAAFGALVKQVRDYPDLSPLRPELVGLDARDGALALAMYEAAIRRWGTLAYLFETILARPWRELDESPRAALLLGGAQLLFLDRVPVYAAIDETVEIVKSGTMARATGLVNAGLRGLARLAGLDATTGLQRIPAWDDRRDAVPLSDGSAVRFVREVLPEESLSRLAIATSVPKPLLEGWVTEFGMEAARNLALHKLVEPPIVLNTSFEVTAHAMLVQHEEAGCHVLGVSGVELAGVLGQLPGAFVQDASSTRAVRAIAARAGELFGEAGPGLIVDLCAGQGTKTRQLARTFPNAKVVATDVDTDRLNVLRGMIAEPTRGMGNVEVWDIASCDGLAGKADIVLLDVPCSNAGVLARRPEAVYRLMTEQMKRLTALQWEIVQRGAKLVRAGGILLYSTCSIERAEDEDIAVRAVQELGLTLLTQDKILPGGLPGEAGTAYRDGAFHAMLRRSEAGSL